MQNSFLDISKLPWESGFVPSDGFRHYIHGSNQKLEFEPCGHVLEDYYNADGRFHSNQWAFEQIEKVRKIQMDNHKRVQNTRTFPHERNLNEGVQCPWCDEKTTGVQYTYNNDVSDMAESKFKAFRIMGWA